ncbi:AMIN domain-containing protein [Stigmatella erecta]|uniref:AMIN domain-containing protein n=1 Tax=Stigmatella erecta TaxID=83460 RepID=A0A1I0ESM8_9BACT|nr:AMIN domain-containing protein [Stigmatella erecta]SET48501.1 AMIN domain-containing protein [Stigmatella erecta]
MKAYAVAVLGWVLLPLFAFAQEKAALNAITRVAVNGGVVEIAGSQKPNFTTFTMTDPPRLVIDISGAVLSGVPEEIPARGGGVTGLRTANYGSEATSVARVLIGYERDVETDIQVSGNVLTVKVLEEGGPAVAQARPVEGDPAPTAEGTAPETQAGTTPPANAQAQREAQEQAAREAQANAQAEEARRQAQETAAATAAAEKQRQQETERVQAEAKRQAEAEAKQRETAQAEARKAAEAEEKQRQAQEAQAKRQAEAEAKQRAQEDARAQAEARKTAQAEEKRRQAEEAQAKREAEAEAKQRAQEDARAQAEARKTAQAEERRRQEEVRAARVASAEPPARPVEREPVATPGISARRKTLEIVGFQQRASSSRVYIRTNERVQYKVSQSDREIILELENTQIGKGNNTRALDTSFFDTAVARVDPVAGPDRSVRVSIRLKEPVSVQTRQEGNTISLEFPR